MIISASRRTDIPTYYSEWFFNRIKVGYVLVRNPMNFHRISRIDVSTDSVDAIVFWTKNPVPMMEKLSLLKDYMYCFQFTVTAYGKDIEPNIPSKSNVIVPAFQRLSDAIGPDRVIWRYDPIMLSAKYSIDYHIRYFEKIAGRLHDYARKCTISFIDCYRNTVKNTKELGLLEFPVEEKIRLGKALSEIAHSRGLKIDACAEQMDLQQVGIGRAQCVDVRLFEKLLGCRLRIEKDKNQRPECGCAASIDIGAYNTCRNGCLYCYANYNAKAVNSNCRAHDPASPLLFGGAGEGDVIYDRVAASDKDGQLKLFD